MDMFEAYLWLVVGCLMIVAYLTGSIPIFSIVNGLFGHRVAKSLNSNNSDIVNSQRHDNRLIFSITFVCDALRGWCVVWFMRNIIEEPAALGLIAVSVFLGKLYPLRLRTKGEKGLATALGVIIALEPLYFSDNEQLIWQTNLPMSLCIIVICVLVVNQYRPNANA